VYIRTRDKKLENLWAKYHPIDPTLFATKALRLVAKGDYHCTMQAIQDDVVLESALTIARYVLG
jgi:hypothetical protein